MKREDFICRCIKLKLVLEHRLITDVRLGRDSPHNQAALDYLEDTVAIII